jgi:HlyD family secretion protein
VGGQVAKLYVKEGDHVKIGQLLLELDNDYLKAEVELASSEQDAAESSASASCLQSDVAHREAERLVQLKGRGAASEDQTDKTVTQAKASAAECAAARARVRVSNSKLGVAMAQLQRTRLFAPFDGVVAQVTGEIFQFVTPSPPGIATKPIIDLIGLDCFVVLAPIDEVDAARVKPGSPAHIMLDAFGDRRFPGQVRRIAPFVQDYEKQARTVDVEVEFTNTADIQELLAGYSANVEIILGVEPQALRIPSDAIIDGEKIFVYDPTSGKLHQRSIRSGLSNWHYTQILSGINDEELVVTSVDRPGVRDGALAVVEGTSR